MAGYLSLVPKPGSDKVVVARLLTKLLCSSLGPASRCITTPVIACPDSLADVLFASGAREILWRMAAPPYAAPLTDAGFQV